MRIAQIALRRRVARLTRRFREARALARAFQWPHRPIVAQIIPTRRCNLSCAYCNEFDRSSAPVPITVLQERIDRLVDLGTGIITLSGGEPLLHPAVDEIVRHVRRRGVIATLITNGYLLTPAMIQRLNGAGLDSLQISIDNVAPDDVSKKSLDLLDRKLQMLAAHAMFDVTVNAVIGGGSAHPEDALIIGRRARALGFQSTVGIIHDAGGQLVPLTDREQRTLRETTRLDRSVFSFDRYNRFQETLAAGKPCAWHCRAGSRYLYVCEDGLVHYCSQQRGHPAIPLAAYSVDDLAREVLDRQVMRPVLHDWVRPPRRDDRRAARGPGRDAPVVVRNSGLGRRSAASGPCAGAPARHGARAAVRPTGGAPAAQTVGSAHRLAATSGARFRLKRAATTKLLHAMAVCAIPDTVRSVPGRGRSSTTATAPSCAR